MIYIFSQPLFDFRHRMAGCLPLWQRIAPASIFPPLKRWDHGCWEMGALAAKRLLSLHHHPLRPLSGPSARAAPLDFLQRFHTQQEGGVPAFFSPAALVVGEGGEGVGGEHDFRKFLSSVSGAGGQGAGFHVHQAAAFLAAAPDFFFRFPEEAVAGPGDGRGEGKVFLSEIVLR